MTPRRYWLGILTLIKSSALAGPLHEAAGTGDTKEVKWLIAERINVNEKITMEPLTSRLTLLATGHLLGPAQ